MLVLRDSSSDSMLLLKVWLITAGIYIWEFVTNLHYEWGLIRGHQTYRWTTWIYLIARWATIIFLTLTFVSMKISTSPINCPAWTWTNWGFASLSLAAGSLLLVLRIVAIWDRNKVIVAIVASLSVVNISLALFVAIRIRSVWDPVSNSCRIINIHTCEITMASIFATDTTLLLIMLAGLLHLRYSGRGSYELWHLLWKQGIIWFVVAAVAELPQVVLMAQNVDYNIHMLFVFPSVVMTTIATTRMHRSLQYFAPSSTVPGSSDHWQKTRNGRLVSKTKNPQASIVRIPPNRLEVSVHTTYEEDLTLQMNHFDSYPDKPRELDIDDKAEGCEGTVTAPGKATV